MECVDDCGCGPNCQNQRFQRQEFAEVTVFKTEKKGYGLRADTDLAPNDFIYEYIGEVIDEARFRRRMLQYDEEGIKHFYFMSLTKGEFVDATKKGNLGRFCNHSCNPNCYVDKWVVGEKLRMGILPSAKSKRAKNWFSITTLTVMEPTHNHVIAVSQTVLDSSVARLRPSVQQNYHKLLSKLLALMMVMGGTPPLRRNLARRRPAKKTKHT